VNAPSSSEVAALFDRTQQTLNELQAAVLALQHGVLELRRLTQPFDEDDFFGKEAHPRNCDCNRCNEDRKLF